MNDRDHPQLLEFDVFLSHSSKDKERVRRLADRLRADGVRVWLDAWTIRPGDHITAKLQAGLDSSRVVLFCMSPRVFESEWAAAERGVPLFSDPLNRSRRFVPLLLEECAIPRSLAPYRYVDYTTESAAAYAEILTACRDGEGREDLVPAPAADLQRRARLFPRLARPRYLGGPGV